MRAIASLLAALLVLVAACGGDGDEGLPDADDADGVSVGEWAASVCGALRPAVGDLAGALAVIDELPAEVDPGAPLGDRIDDLETAFAALPAYTQVYVEAVRDTPVPSIADGPAFRDEVLAVLNEAGRTFTRTSAFVDHFGAETTAEQFFGQAQAFAGFSDALAAVDLDFGPDVPPDIADALTAEADCRAVSDQLAAALG